MTTQTNETLPRPMMIEGRTDEERAALGKEAEHVARILELANSEDLGFEHATDRKLSVAGANCCWTVYAAARSLLEALVGVEVADYRAETGELPPTCETCSAMFAPCELGDLHECPYCGGNYSERGAAFARQYGIGRTDEQVTLARQIAEEVTLALYTDRSGPVPVTRMSLDMTMDRFWSAWLVEWDTDPIEPACAAATEVLLARELACQEGEKEDRALGVSLTSTVIKHTH